MAIFRYTSTKEMAPKDGANYATTYYKQKHEEHTRTLEHIRMVASEIVEACEKNLQWAIFCQEPLKGFPRTSKRPNYTIEDIVSDLMGQMTLGNDIPSGMIGRWNRLFHDTEYDIELLQEQTPTKVSPRLFDNLFNRHAGKR